MISATKTELITKGANNIQREISVWGQTLGTVSSFMYLGAIVLDDGSNPKDLTDLTRLYSSDKAEAKLRDNSIPLGSKVQRMRSLDIAIYIYMHVSH